MILFPPAKGAILSAWLAAEADAVLQSHRERVTAGRPGAVSARTGPGRSTTARSGQLKILFAERSMVPAAGHQTSPERGEALPAAGCRTGAQIDT